MQELEQSQPDPAEVVYTKKEKLEKLTEWWAIIDVAAKGNTFGEEDWKLILSNMEDEAAREVFQLLPLPVVDAFIKAYNASRSQFGAKFKETISKEMALRKEVVSMYFPKPEEGTNNTALANGWKLKFTNKIDRKINEEVLPSVVEQIRALGVNPDPLTKVEHSVSIKEYRALETLNPDAFKLFETALTIKPAAPVLELVPPKVKKGEEA